LCIARVPRKRNSSVTGAPAENTAMKPHILQSSALRRSLFVIFYFYPGRLHKSFEKKLGQSKGSVASKPHMATRAGWPIELIS
jgi:hypothetical protein